MKHKIVEALKAYAKENKLVSISERTLSAYADGFVPFVTDEAQIPTVLAPVLPVLKELQGNISFTAAQAVEAKRKEWESLNPTPAPIPTPAPSPAPNPTPTPAPTDPSADLLKKFEQLLAPLTQKVEAITKERQVLTLQQQLAATFKEKNVPDYFYNTFVKHANISTSEEATLLVEEVAQAWDVTNQKTAEGRFEGFVPPATATKTVVDNGVTSQETLHFIKLANSLAPKTPAATK
jgi:hypothetical protein